MAKTVTEEKEKKKRKKKRTDTVKKLKRREEHDMQCSVVSWVRQTGIYIFPELLLFHASTGGQPRYGWAVQWFKDEGLEGGFPDTHLPVPRGGYAGLWIEFKTKTGSPTDQQLEKIALLREQGNYVVIRDDPNEAIWTIIDYLLCNID